MKNKLANLGFELSRNAQKKIVGGCSSLEEEEDGLVNCIKCLNNDGCTSGRVCESSRSCPNIDRVCKKVSTVMC
jgi:hypothetical protein